MRCWRDWLGTLSSTGVRLLQQRAQRCQPVALWRQTLCRHTHTRPGVPGAPNTAPTPSGPPQLRASLTFGPGGLGLPEQRHGGDRPGGGTGPGTGGCPPAGPPALAPRFPLAAGPCPLLSLPAVPLAAESSSPCPGGAGRGGRREKRHLRPYIRTRIPHPHPHPHPTTAPASAAGTRLRRGRCGAARRELWREGAGGAAPHCLAPGRARRRRGRAGRGLLAGAGAVTGLGR